MQPAEKQKHHPSYAKKREEIIRAAEKRFIRHGLGKTTIEEIARDLRVGKASLYHYFATKEELFNETVKFQADDFLQSVSQIFNDENLSPVERVSAYYSLKKNFGNRFKLLDQLLAAFLNGTSLPEEDHLVAAFLKRESELLRLALPTLLPAEKEQAGKQISGILPLFGILLGKAEKLIALLAAGDDVAAASAMNQLDLLLRAITIDPPSPLSKYQISSGA